MSKLIGLLGHKHSGEFNPGYGQNRAYVEFFRQFGDVIIIDAQAERTFDLDLLVLPGGRDVNPLRYNQRPHVTTQSPDLEYEWFFASKFKDYLKKAENNEMAIYGICAGFQNLVVEFGGTISQDIAQKQSFEFRGELVDFLDFNTNNINKKGGILASTHSKNKHEVDYKKTNSIHHQGVFVDDLNEEEFDVIASNRVYDNVEFIYHKTLPIAAEQSHPEERINPLLTFGIIDHLFEQIN